MEADKTKNWATDPNTEMTCVNCRTTWKLRDSIVCPSCEEPDGGLNEN